MPPKARWGGILFAIAGGLLAMLVIRGLVTSLAGPAEFSYLKFGMRCWVLLSLVGMAMGSSSSRWLPPFWCLVTGGMLLWGAVPLMMKARELAPIFLPICFLAAVYLACGAILYSPYVRAFVLFQRFEGTNLLARWGRLLDVFRDEEESEKLFRFYHNIDQLNEQASGGAPVLVEKKLGTLDLHSGSLRVGDVATGDAVSACGIRVSGIDASQVEIQATLRKYPSRSEVVCVLRIIVGQPGEPHQRRELGRVGVDSARVVVADAEDLSHHWSEEGLDRIGEISTIDDGEFLNAFRKRFGLRIKQVDPISVRIASPITAAQQQEIEAFEEELTGNTEDWRRIFTVRTNNTFDRILGVEGWNFIPIGNEQRPLMFVCQSGRGDGSYLLYGDYAGDRLYQLELTFIEVDEG